MSTEHDDEKQELVIKDTDDYNQARRLKTIHQARDDVREARKAMPKGSASASKHLEAHVELAEAVATYGHELLPLMNKAGWEHEYEDGKELDNVRDFVRSMGSKGVLNLDDPPYVPTYVSMDVYSKLNAFMADVGLGADFDDNTDEWEI